MLEVESRFEYSVSLKSTYKFKFDNDKSNHVALHQYILSLLFGSQFVDENGNVDMDLVSELGRYLEFAANSDSAEP